MSPQKNQAQLPLTTMTYSTTDELPWRRLLFGPALFFAVAMALFAAYDIDRLVADALFSAGTGFPFQRSDSYEFWTHWLPRKVAAFTFFAVVLISTLPREGRRWLNWYAPLWLGIISMLIATSVIGDLKASTGIYCPVQHVQFGGKIAESYMGPFPLRIDDGGHCWPAGHATNGLAFISLYFSFMVAGRKRLANTFLVSGLLAGHFLGLAQVIRGQHFLSHQLWSTAICWFIPLALFWLFSLVKKKFHKP